jgi:hypothetical protein
MAVYRGDIHIEATTETDDRIDAILAMPEIPEIPDELWMLWHPASEDGPGHWIPSVDDVPMGATFLASTSRSDAETAAEHQNAMYDLDCIPVRVK